MLTLDKVFDASNVLKEVIRPTACIHAPKVNPDCDVYLKTENLQVTGSFKVRGAYYKISQLSDEEKSHGVIACSAGNHAQGVALAATKNGIKSIICLPDGAPISKVEATKGYGAEVCLVPGVYDDAYAKAIELRDANGYTFIHPFDDENVIAGQGTIGLEILSQVADADVIVVPVGRRSSVHAPFPSYAAKIRRFAERRRSPAPSQKKKERLQSVPFHVLYISRDNEFPLL